MRKKLSLGDVVEIKLSSGVAYAQYTHEHKSYLSLLRILSDFNCYEGNGGRLGEGDLAFSCFYPLKFALKCGVARVLFNLEVPDCWRDFPIFRATNYMPFYDDGERDWWLWDGDKEWRIGRLPPEMRGYPIREVLSFDLLVKRIESKWHPGMLI